MAKKTYFKKGEFLELFYETMELVYLMSNPSASFEVLMKISPKDDEGRIVIPYEDYELNDFLLDSIVDSQAKKYNLNNLLKEQLRHNVLLGASPMPAERKKRGN